MWTHSRASGRRGFRNARNKDAKGDPMVEPTDPEHHQGLNGDSPYATGLPTSGHEIAAGVPSADLDAAGADGPRSWFEPVVPPPDAVSPPPPADVVPLQRELSAVAAAAPAQTMREPPAEHLPDPTPEPAPEPTPEPAATPLPSSDHSDDETGDQTPMVDPMAYSTTGLDVAALRESVALIDGHQDQLGSEFYSTLFAHYPDLRDLFPAGMEVQRSRLVGALVHIVGTADDREALVPYLEALGRDHRKFGVITQHYGSLGSSLVMALRKVVGEDWTERHEKAWIQAYDAVAKIMVEGSERDAVIYPPWWDGEVVFHRRVLDDLAVIQVRPHTDYPYRPGQYAYLMSPRRPKLWRAYSMASAQRHDGLLEFHVRAIGAGWVSSALVWRTEPGDVLRLGAPQGYDIANPRSERDLLCIAGGTGIAPVLAGLQELEQRLDGRRVHVFYAGRDRDSLYALPHLESIGVRYRKLTVVPVVSPEGPEDRSPDLMGNIVSAYGDWRRHNVYVAGPTIMVQATLDRLREQGVPDDQISCDDYGIW